MIGRRIDSEAGWRDPSCLLATCDSAVSVAIDAIHHLCDVETTTRKKRAASLFRPAPNPHENPHRHRSHPAKPAEQAPARRSPAGQQHRTLNKLPKLRKRPEMRRRDLPIPSPNGIQTVPVPTRPHAFPSPNTKAVKHRVPHVSFQLTSATWLLAVLRVPVAAPLDCQMTVQSRGRRARRSSMSMEDQSRSSGCDEVQPRRTECCLRVEVG